MKKREEKEENRKKNPYIRKRWKRENLKNIYVEETGGEIILEKYWHKKIFLPEAKWHHRSSPSAVQLGVELKVQVRSI